MIKSGFLKNRLIVSKSFSEDINTLLKGVLSLVYRWQRWYWQLYVGSKV